MRQVSAKNSLVFMVLLSILFSCESEEHGKKIKEGVVEYTIDYVKKTDNQLVQALLPTSVNFKFDPEHTKTSFSGSLGFYELSYLANNETETWSILYQLKRNIYLYEQKLDEPKLLGHEIEILEIQETNETKKIANYTCRKLKIITNSDEYKESEIYYTDKIRFDFPTLLNLFGKIDGILMEFELPEKDMLLHVTAKSVESKEIDKEEFAIPEKAQRIKKSMMVDLLNTEF